MQPVSESSGLLPSRTGAKKPEQVYQIMCTLCCAAAMSTQDQHTALAAYSLSVKRSIEPLCRNKAQITVTASCNTGNQSAIISTDVRRKQLPNIILLDTLDKKLVQHLSQVKFNSSRRRLQAFQPMNHSLWFMSADAIMSW